LTAPPAAIIVIIPFSYNVLQRHPVLMTMINRVEETSDKDPFKTDEKDPMSTSALESSLWELVTHRNHYHSSVSTLAKIFQEAFRKQNYDLEDFLDHTYGTVSNVFSPWLIVVEMSVYSYLKVKRRGRSRRILLLLWS
jgi:U3 small nucleolar RNA-associated protein 19